MNNRAEKEKFRTLTLNKINFEVRGSDRVVSEHGPILKS